MAQSQIGELARTSGWKGAGSTQYTEPGAVQTLPVIDNSVRTQTNIRTSVDCYVSGSYVTTKGKTFEVTQRYTIFVAYSKETQTQTMSQIRERVVSDFQARYGKTFNVTNIFVPGLKEPAAKKPVAPAEFYHGTDLARSMSRYERVRWETGGEKLKARTNIESIKRRYKMK